MRQKLIIELVIIYTLLVDITPLLSTLKLKDMCSVTDNVRQL